MLTACEPQRYTKKGEHKMKKVFVLLMIVSVFIVRPLYAEKKNPLSVVNEKSLRPGKVEQKIIRILGDNDWLDTGFVLKPNDRIEIKATGEVCFSNGEKSSGVTPDGYNREHYENDYSKSDYNYCGDPDENWDHAALIGKDDKGMFFLGKSKLITGKKGKFYIGINDCSFNTDYYNTGEFSVVIKVIRGK